jgi:hypothetical protein
MPVRRKRPNPLTGKLVMAVLTRDDEQAIAPCRRKYSWGVIGESYFGLVIRQSARRIA